MVCFSIFLPLLKGEMPEGQREFRRKALPRCAGTISRCREAFPKSSEAPRAVAKRFRRVLKLLAPSRSPSAVCGNHFAMPRSPSAMRGNHFAVSRRPSEEFGNLPSPESGPPISVLLFFS